MAYTQDKLKRNEFFSKYNDLELVLDYLSGVISRGCFLDYVNSLIAKEKPFSFYIFDIDNFKNVNDTYGHQVGDYLITMLAARLIESVGDDGFVGRYGGDEFVIVSEKHISYQEMWFFIKSVYTEVRKAFTVNGDEMVLTITSGGASFPNDAKTYDELFQTADKALYRGKEKGRNCFIIYVEEKHKDIITNAIRENQLCDRIDFVYSLFSQNDTLKNRIKKCFEYIFTFYSISAFYIQAKTGKVLVNGKTIDALGKIDLKELDKLFGDNNSVTINDYSNIAATHYEFHKFCWENDWKSFTAVKVYAFDKLFGYLIFIDKNIKRIWQNDDKVLFDFFAKVTALSSYYEKVEE